MHSAGDTPCQPQGPTDTSLEGLGDTFSVSPSPVAWPADGPSAAGHPPLLPLLGQQGIQFNQNNFLSNGK